MTNSPEQQPEQTTVTEPQWQPYDLDYYAQQLILKYRDQDVLNETHNMRMTVAYGLERFWGEHLRLKKIDSNKASFWKDVWDKLAKILAEAGIELPNDPIPRENNTEQIKTMSKKIWLMDMSDKRIVLMVLTQFCDCLVWWKQRYKKK